MSVMPSCPVKELDLRHERADIKATIGEPLSIDLEFIDAETGLPYDLTADTVTAELETLAGAAVSPSPWTVTVTDAAGGLVTLSMDATAVTDDLGLGSWTWSALVAFGAAAPIYVVGGVLSIYSVGSFGSPSSNTVTVNVQGVIRVGVTVIAAGVSDAAVAALIADPASATRAALDAWAV